MTVRLAIVIAAVAVLSGHGFAQDPYQQILRSLEAGKEGDAANQLLRVIRAGPSDARTVLLDQCYTSFRQRGTSAAWLRCLGQALEAAPADVELLWFRAYTRIELKLLAGARDDLQTASKAAPGDPRIRQGRGWIAALSFDHRAAARLLSGIDGKGAAYHARLAASLDSARTRQITGLIMGIGLVTGLVLAAWRISRPSRS